MKFEVKPLSDREKIAVLKQRAVLKGVSLQEKAVNFLLTHCSRNLKALFAIFEQLEEASLQYQRQVTVPLVKEVLGL